MTFTTAIIFIYDSSKRITQRSTTISQVYCTIMPQPCNINALRFFCVTSVYCAPWAGGAIDPPRLRAWCGVVGVCPKIIGGMVGGSGKSGVWSGAGTWIYHPHSLLTFSNFNLYIYILYSPSGGASASSFFMPIGG